MATFGLWYLKWNGRAYISRLRNNARKRACEYAKYTWDYPHKAYYFGTELRNIDIMNEYCIEKIGHKYI